MRSIPSWMTKRRSESASPESGDSVPGIHTATYGDAAMVTVDLDSFNHRDAPQIYDEIIRGTGFPLFEGAVEHGYSKRAAGSTDKRPSLRVRHDKAECKLHICHQYLAARDAGAGRVLLLGMPIRDRG